MRDVIVVGGGPAGSATAIALAQRGYDVELFERATFPRAKACGEGVLPAGVAALARLGVPVERLDPAAHLTSIRFHAGDHAAVGRIPAGGALGVERTVLDAALLDRARSVGVACYTGTAVRGLAHSEAGTAGVIVDHGEVRARMVVAADGIHSRLRREAGLDAGHRGGRQALTFHLEAGNRDRETIEVRFRRRYEVYITPIGNDRINVAVLSDRALIRELARNGMEGLARLVDEELGVGASAIARILGGGPFPATSAALSRGRVVLAGDAAGFVDGITGEGISLALQGAERCAEAIDVALRTGRRTSLRRYERQVRALGRNSSLLARLSLFLARRPRLAAAAIESLAMHPEVFDRLIRINCGEAGLAALRSGDLAGLADPRALLRTLRE